MNKTYLTNILRDIKNTKGKVISIGTMVGLASLVVVALTMTGPSMRKTLENSLNTYNHPDTIVRSTYGLDYEDELILKKDPDIEKMSLVKTADLLESENLIRLKSFDKQIPKSAVVKGRMPEDKSEIALDASLSNKYKIGDKLDFSYIENAQIDQESMDNLSYKVVGFFKSSDYFMEDMRQISFLGKKELDGYAYVLEENFSLDKYGEANIIYKQSKDMDKNSKTYQDFVRNKKESIEESIKNRPGQVLEEVKDDANKELDEAQDKIDSYNDELKEGRQKLHQARKDLDQGYIDYDNGKKTLENELLNGKSNLENARIELINGQEKLDQGRISYQENLKKYKDEIGAAESEISKKQKELGKASRDLEDAQAEISQSYNKLDSEFAGPKSELKESKAYLDGLKFSIDEKSSKLDQLIKSKENSPDLDDITDVDIDKLPIDSPDYNSNISGKDIEKLKKELDLVKSDYQKALEEYQDKNKQLQASYDYQKSKIDQAQAELNQKRYDLDKGINKLNTGKDDLARKKTEGKSKLDQALSEINQKQKEIDNGWTTYNNGIEELNNKEIQAKENLKKSYQELLDGEEEYQKNLKDFKEKEDKALADIDQGQKDIEENRDSLARLVDPVYDIETIYDNEGIKTYHQNSLNMDELTKVFPTFFYLVAMLVTITTMKRYIDEQRTINGTLKSLGYTNRQISQRFYIYGIIPGLIGSIIGALVGRYVVAGVIINAYSSGFANLSVDYVSPLPYITFAVILSTLLIGLTVFLTSKKTVNETPAALLSPKAPDSGKKILLETISPIWKRLSFMQKITSRNIFRYKSRMFMTLFGVGGCTALTFFGFAMIDSIKDTVDYQQNQISHYDVIAMVDENANKEDLESIQKKIKAYKSIPIRYEEITLKRNGKSRNLNLVIPESNGISDFFTLRNKDRTSLDLRGEDGLISEKASKVLDIKEGDKIDFDYDGKNFDLAISDTIENYTGDYIFIDRGKFTKLSGVSPKTNAYYIKGDADSIIEDIEDEKAINAMLNTSVVYASMDVLMDNLNLVIGVITLISILLALVVLYNLININVSERKRELATIKVLGFYPKEVTSYIFREIFILSLLGIIVGYGLGYAMFRYIIYVVAPEDILLSYGVHPNSFILSGFITIGISVVLLLVVHNKLKRIDMAEAMSSGE